MDFLVNPIRHLFREDMKGLAPMLMRLSALSVRFEQRYQEADRINWTRPFEMESYYLSGLLVRRPADVMARVFTFYDKHNSTILLPTNFMNPDGVVWFLNASWRQLAKYAAECYVGNPDVFGHLQDLIRVRMLHVHWMPSTENYANLAPSGAARRQELQRRQCDFTWAKGRG